MQSNDVNKAQDSNISDVQVYLPWVFLENVGDEKHSPIHNSRIF